MSGGNERQPTQKRGPVLLSMVTKGHYWNRRRLSPWTGTWTGVREFPVLSVHSRAAGRSIVAGQARAATERASFNPLVQGSTPWRPTWSFKVPPGWPVDRFVDRALETFFSVSRPADVSGLRRGDPGGRMPCVQRSEQCLRCEAGADAFS
jgi:hypothetical protein